ncbi:MAG: ABC transporter ATP-binding protein [Candidatus Thermoplasmatota archaeon]|nr:ABC transporter ATP-binding protein [Candidatus Thermoplasmatota archaeon]
MDIELREVSRRFRMGETFVHALSEINLVIKGGEMMSVTGPSGSGKTTLLNIIGTLDRPTSGRLILDGENVTDLSEGRLSKIRLTRFGFIFQQFYLLPTLTAFQNVYLPIRENGGYGPSGKKRARELLGIVGLSHRMKHLPSQLSGGEQQRVAIARALANDPPTILADEPTGELDSENSKIIIDTLRDLNRDTGKTVIMVTHDPEIARRSKRIVRMKDGKILK